jgi:hypothetical protein
MSYKDFGLPKPFEKHTVKELTVLLEGRKLSSRGNKPELIERLKESLQKEFNEDAATLAQAEDAKRLLNASEPAVTPIAEPVDIKRKESSDDIVCIDIFSLILFSFLGRERDTK